MKGGERVKGASKGSAARGSGLVWSPIRVRQSMNEIYTFVLFRPLPRRDDIVKDCILNFTAVWLARLPDDY